MKNKIFAVYDPDGDYAEKLSAFLSGEDYDYRFCSFSDWENLTESLSRDPVQVLLAEPDKMAEDQLLKLKAMEGDQAERVLLFRHLREKTEKTGTVFKYSGGREIFQEAMENGENASAGPAGPASPACRRFGVFSPADETAAAELLRFFAREDPGEGRFLFFNMETFTDDPELLSRKGDFSDYAYYYRQNRLTKDICERMWETGTGSLSVPPSFNPEDLDEMSPEDLIRIWDAVSSFGFDRVMINAGSRPSGIRAVFTWCECVFVPDSVRQDGRYDHFCRYLRGTGKGEWEKKLRFLPRPDSEDHCRQLRLAFQADP